MATLERKESYVEPSLAALHRNGSELLVGDRWKSLRPFALRPLADDDDCFEGKRRGETRRVFRVAVPRLLRYRCTRPVFISGFPAALLRFSPFHNIHLTATENLARVCQFLIDVREVISMKG